MERYETPYMHGIYREQLDIIDIVQSRVNGINDQCVVDYACAMDRDENLPMIQVLQMDIISVWDRDDCVLLRNYHY